MTTTDSTGLRIVFAGTPAFAAHHLDALISSRHKIVAVYTQPDRPAGRGKKLKASEVKTLALEHDLPVYQPQSLKGEAEQRELATLDADVMVVVAYGLLLPKAVLATPKHGCLNVHGSLLPQWRGAAPIQRAVGAGDAESGVTIMQMDEGLDTGDMLLKASLPLADDETSASLHDKLMPIGAQALLDTLDLLQAGELKPEKQDESLASYASKISKEEARINWQLEASASECAIRAYNPFPIAWSEIGGQRVKIYSAKVVSGQGKAGEKAGEIVAFNEQGITVACDGDSALQITSLQLPGKKAMDAAALFNGYRDLFAVGHSFSG